MPEPKPDLSQIELLFSKISEGLAYCKVVTDDQGRPVDWVYLEVNDAYERINGVKRDAVVGKKVSEAIPDLRHDSTDWINLYGEVALTGEPVVTERFSKARNKWYHVSAFSPQKGFFVSIFEDITARKKTEEALKKSEEKYRSLFVNMIDGFAHCQMIYDDKDKPVDFVYLDINDAFERLTGLKRETVLGKKVSEAIPGTLEANPELIETYGRVASTGKEERFEIYFKPLSTWFSISVYSERKGYFIAVFENITDRKNAEEALKRLNENLEDLVRNRTEEVVNERQRLYNVLETLPVYVVLLDKDYKVPFANKFFRERFGESHGLRCYEYLFNRSSACENCETYKVQKSKMPQHWEWTGPDKHIYDIYDFPFVESDGSNLILEMGIDITERRHAEEELGKYREHLEQLVKARTEQLSASEQRWSTTLSSIGDAVIAADIESKITFMNPVAEALTGWTLEEVKQKPVKQVFNIINEQTRKEVESPVLQVLRKGLIVGLANHTVLTRKDGTEVPIDDSGAPIVTEDGVIQGVVLVFRDITQRKKTEEAIQRQASLIDLSPDAIIVRKPEGTITFWSKGAERLYGWTKEEALGRSTHELFGTKFPMTFEKIVSELEIKLRWTGELIHKTKDGREIIVQSWWLAEKTEHGKIKSILESNMDLTERKEAEKEIARLASFPTLSPSPIIEVTVDGKITFANPATKTIFPTLEAAGLGHLLFSDWETVKEAFADKSKTTFGREVKISGHWYYQQFNLAQTGQIRIYMTDIDELKQTEEARAQAQKKLEENAVMLEEYASQMEELAEQRAQQLQNAERMAAIGQTAGMVGHDIRNPLQAITSDMYIISEEVKAMTDDEGKEAIMESVDSVNQNLGYINKIVSDLQDYTRPLKPNFQDANLAELVEGTLVTINIPKGIEVTTDIKNTAKPIKTDVAYMRRILTNLMTNAIQAMEEEGKLAIQAAGKKGAFVVTVEDTGAGIPEEVKTKLFTPLFTTKSKGQGLGLAVVKRLVEALKGTIKFESTEGKGTRFTLEFPQEK